MDKSSLRDRRNGQLDTDSGHAFGNNSQLERSLCQDSVRVRPRSRSPSQISPSIGDVGGYNSHIPEQAGAFIGENIPAISLSHVSGYGQEARQPTGVLGGASVGRCDTANMVYNVPQVENQTSPYDARHYRQTRYALQSTPSNEVSSYFTLESSGNSGLNLQLATSAGAGFEQHRRQRQRQHQHKYSPKTSPLSYQDSIHRISTVPSGPAVVDAMSADPDPDKGDQEDKWHSYQTKLGTIFNDISEGSLENAFRTLLDISNWLLSQVVGLGLTKDNANLHEERIKLWNDFNHAWLALGYRQREMMATGEALSHGQTVLTKDMISKMGDELIRFCDGIERQGLVDYQYGVWEDQIVRMLEECLDQFDTSNDTSTSGTEVG